jgi:hypothetical protein
MDNSFFLTKIELLGSGPIAGAGLLRSWLALAPIGFSDASARQAKIQNA